MKNMFQILFVVLSFVVVANLEAEWIDAGRYQYAEHNIKNFNQSLIRNDSIRLMNDSSLYYFDANTAEYYPGRNVLLNDSLPVFITRDDKNGIYTFYNFSRDQYTSYYQYFSDFFNYESNEYYKKEVLTGIGSYTSTGKGNSRSSYEPHLYLNLNDSTIVYLLNRSKSGENWDTGRYTYQAVHTYGYLRKIIQDSVIDKSIGNIALSNTSNDKSKVLFTTKNYQYDLHRGTLEENYSIYYYNIIEDSLERITFHNKLDPTSDPAFRFEKLAISDDGECKLYYDKWARKLFVNYFEEDEISFDVSHSVLDFIPIYNNDLTAVFYEKPLRVEIYSNKNGALVETIEIETQSKYKQSYIQSEDTFITATDSSFFKFDIYESGIVNQIYADTYHLIEGEFIEFFAILPQNAEVKEWIIDNVYYNDENVKLRARESKVYKVSVKYNLYGEEFTLQRDIEVTVEPKLNIELTKDKEQYLPEDEIKISTGIMAKDYPEIKNIKWIINGNLIKEYNEGNLAEISETELELNYQFSMIGEYKIELVIFYFDKEITYSLEKIIPDYNFKQDENVLKQELITDYGKSIFRRNKLYTQRENKLLMYDDNFNLIKQIELQYKDFLIHNDKVVLLDFSTTHPVFTKFYEYDLDLNLLREVENENLVRDYQTFLVNNDNQYVILARNGTTMIDIIEYNQDFELNNYYDHFYVHHLENHTYSIGYSHDRLSLNFARRIYFKYSKESLYTITMQNKVDNEKKMRDYNWVTYKTNDNVFVEEYGNSTDAINVVDIEDETYVFTPYQVVKFQGYDHEPDSIDFFRSEEIDLKFRKVKKIDNENMLVSGQYIEDFQTNPLQMPVSENMYPGLGTYNLSSKTTDVFIKLDFLKGTISDFHKITEDEYFLIVEEDYIAYNEETKVESIEKAHFLIHYDLDPTSVSENESGIAIYPNPASDYIEVNPPQSPFGKGGSELASRGISEITITNMLGVVVSTSVNFVDTSANGGQVRIDVSHLPRGVYFLRIGTQVEKFVKW